MGENVELQYRTGECWTGAIRSQRCDDRAPSWELVWVGLRSDRIAERAFEAPNSSACEGARARCRSALCTATSWLQRRSGIGDCPDRQRRTCKRRKTSFFFSSGKGPRSALESQIPPRGGGGATDRSGQAAPGTIYLALVMERR